MSHRTKQRVYAVFDEASTPPNALTSTQTIARVIKPGGNGCYVCALPDKQTILAELPSRFNSTVWFKPGNYVVVDTKDAMLKGSKIGGEILNIVRDEHAWRKESYWPQEFPKSSSAYDEDSDEQESTVGKMPPSDSEEEV